MSRVTLQLVLYLTVIFVTYCLVYSALRNSLSSIDYIIAQFSVTDIDMNMPVPFSPISLSTNAVVQD